MRLQTQVAPEIQKRLLLSRVEAESLKERDWKNWGHWYRNIRVCRREKI